MTPDEARFQLGPLEYVLEPELTRMVEHEGQVVGVALGVPDLVPLLQKMRGRLFPLGWWHFLRRRSIITDATVIIILTRKAFQAKGLIRVLTAELLDAARRGNYRKVYGTWIGDDNAPSLKAAAAVGMKPFHRLFMFERAL
jgi:GNAT superfamily N-acetyltransferase